MQSLAAAHNTSQQKLDPQGALHWLWPRRTLCDPPGQVDCLCPGGAGGPIPRAQAGDLVTIRHHAHDGPKRAYGLSEPCPRIADATSQKFTPGNPLRAFIAQRAGTARTATAMLEAGEISVELQRIFFNLF